MFKIRRNQVVIAALAAMIGAAGYLSYLDRKGGATAAADLDDYIGGLALTSSGDISALVVDGATGQEIPIFSDYAAFDEDIGIALTYDDGAAGASVSNGVDAQNEDYTNYGEAIFVSSTDISNFFATEKLDREQGRARQRELLMEMINSSNLDKDTKTAAADKLLDIQSRIENETAAEAMLAAKGFGQTYVRIDDDTVDVIVSRNGLSDQEIAQIEDIVKRKTGMGLDSIRISSIKR